MKKFLALIGIVFLLASLIVPLVSADADLLVFSQAYSGSYWYDVYNLHPSAGVGKSGIAQLFKVTAGGYATDLNVVMCKVGSPNFNLTLSVYGAGTTDVTTAALNTTLYGTSITTWNTQSVSTDIYAYPFDMNSTFQYVSGACYYAVLTINGGAGDASNYVKVYFNSGTVSGADYTAGYSMGAWVFTARKSALSVYANVDPVYTLSTDPTPTPYPSGSSGSGDGDADIENLTNIILPWLVPLLICLIPALLGYKFVGELGFFIGLNVGCILAYVTLASTAYAFPLWGIILVGVMDVAVVLMRR